MNTIILDVDTQNRFMYPNGKDFIEGNDEVIPYVNKVIENALRYEKLIVSTVYSPVLGLGMDKIHETILVDEEFYYNVANTKHGIDMNVAEACWHIALEKECSDIWDASLGQPDNLETFLRTEGVNTITVIGNNHNGAVRDAIDGLLRSKYVVRIVTDAITNNFCLPDSVDVTRMTTEEFIAECEEGAKDE